MSSLPFVLCLPREMGTIFPCGAAYLTGTLRPALCAFAPALLQLRRAGLLADRPVHSLLRFR